jgi:hypothetical protein
MFSVSTVEFDLARAQMAEREREGARMRLLNQLRRVRRNA